MNSSEVDWVSLLPGVVVALAGSVLIFSASTVIRVSGTQTPPDLKLYLPAAPTAVLRSTLLRRACSGPGSAQLPWFPGLRHRLLVPQDSS